MRIRPVLRPSGGTTKHCPKLLPPDDKAGIFGSPLIHRVRIPWLENGSHRSGDSLLEENCKERAKDKGGGDDDDDDRKLAFKSSAKWPRSLERLIYIIH